jgi:DNA-binding beta-propeller fold protein YncE
MPGHRGFYVQLAFLLLLSLTLGSASPARAQTPTPLAGLETLPLIPMPTWTSGAPGSGVSAQVASTDVFSFDPATHTMYFADRTNQGVSAIDTRTNTYIGTIVVPGCAGLNSAGQGSCPSGVLVAPDVHKLVITDRSNGGTATTTQLLNHVFIYDLRLGQFTPPEGLALPAGLAPDELDYDPLNQRAYVGNTTAPFFLTVVDLVTNAIVDQIPLPGNVEQPRFNPVDGRVCATVPDDDHMNPVVLCIDPTLSGQMGTSAAPIVAVFPTPGCGPRGIEIDPLTNTAVIGCTGSNA